MDGAREEAACGTSTRPPPAFAQASIAWAMALVLSIVASGIAPCFVMSNRRSGNVGARRCARVGRALPGLGGTRVRAGSQREGGGSSRTVEKLPPVRS